ncbi:recombinase family protein [Lacrimispora algidixylanolytica]|nr:recombinase family protein [Lacrimispora algidixylanolytica]
MIQYYAGLYMRLSKDDDRALESASIDTQRKMLYFYAKENGFEIYDEYVDDGYSGTNFSRPAWERLLGDIEAKKVNLVITKDLSRLGRDYIMTGQYTEIYFPARKVRYIAINDGYDSNSSFNDIAPFKNMVNEMYARDTSKKIRSAFQTKIKEGEFIGNFAPYGYQKDPNNKNHLIADPLTAPIVRSIFQHAEQGEAPLAIAARLNEQKVETPLKYRCLTHPYLKKGETTKDSQWTSGAICKVLSNEVYLGHVVQGKTTKLSFKSNITLSQPRKEWVVVKNKHEALVTQETFDHVKKRCIPRKKREEREFLNVFSGLAVCEDCKRNMSVTYKKGKPEAAQLVCSGYKQFGKKVCTSHKISYHALYHKVAEEITTLLNFTQDRQEEMRKALKRSKGTSPQKEPVKALGVLKKRDREISSIIGQLYEDKVNQRISEERFYDMLSALEQEQKGINYKLRKAMPEPVLQKDEMQTDDPELERLMKELHGEMEISPELLLSLIDKIEIGQKDEKTENEGLISTQTIRIFFKSDRPTGEYDGAKDS